MATLRDKVWKRTGSITEFIDLETSQTAGFSTSEIVDGAADERRIRIIPYGEFALTQDLLHVAEDLIENDRRINNEVNMGHSILSEGIFNDESANFSITLTYDAVQPNIFKEFNVIGGKFKTNNTIYQITLEEERGLLSLLPGSPTQEEIDKYSITDLADVAAKPYRRDYISVVYYDSDVNAESTPYWKYTMGEQTYSEPIPKHLQKLYDVGSIGEEWPSELVKFDLLGHPAVYREFIIYSFLFYYNTNGSWDSLTVGEGINFPASPPPEEGDYFYITDGSGGEDQGLYKYDGANWSESPLTCPVGSEFPLTDRNYFKADGTGTPTAGFYQFESSNKYTQLLATDIIPDITGIADVVNFVDSLPIHHQITGDDEFELYKVSGSDRKFYHPYKEALSMAYGQGVSVVKEGTENDPYGNYILNRLMYEYADLDSQDTSLFNFPFRVESVENDYTLSNDILLAHILLGYKKEGFWNGDHIYNTDDTEYYKMENGDWSSAFTITAISSWLPHAPFDNEYFYADGDGTPDVGLYQYDSGGSTWGSELQHRKGNKWPATVSIDQYFEILNGVISGIDDGLYQYGNDGDPDVDRWGHYDGNFEIETPYTHTTGDEFPGSPSEGDYFKATGYGAPEKGWWYYSGTLPWDQLEYTYGDTFPGGEDSEVTPRWNENPVDDEYFKAYGIETYQLPPDDSFPPEGWWQYSLAGTYWHPIVVHEGNEFPLLASDDDYFISNGIEISSGGPASGLYQYEEATWGTALPYTIVDDFPTEKLYNGRHVYADGTGIPTEGLYRYVEGSWGSTLSYDTGSTFPGSPVDGDYFKSNGGGTPTEDPAAGWYRYDASGATWDVLGFLFGSEFPEFGIEDKDYFESDGTGSLAAGFYRYDADIAYWLPITSIGGPTDELPVSAMEHGDYHETTGLGTVLKGYYKYAGNIWVWKDYTEEAGIPDLEDDFMLEVIQPLVFKSSTYADEVLVSKIDNSSSYRDDDTGTIDIQISELLETRRNLDGGTVRDIAVGDLVIVTSGWGKYQIGHIVQLIKAGTPYEENIIIEGLYTDLESSADDNGHLATSDDISNIIFCSASDYIEIDEMLLTKVDAMQQIDDIDNFVPGQDQTEDEELLPQKLDESEDLYQIKISANDDKYIQRNEWNIIRVRSERAVGGDLTWDPPKVIIATPNISAIEVRTGYYNVRYFTVEGLYPYYGLDDENEIDYDIKYLVIEDTTGGDIWYEAQIESAPRLTLIGFKNFKVIAKNLDDINAPIVYDWLQGRSVENEIFVDVALGRVMFHPNVTNEIETNDNYKIRISFIVLNILTGYIDTDNIVHVDHVSGQKYILYNKIKELEAGSGGGGTSGRKIFTYRGKWARIYQNDIDDDFKGNILMGTLGLGVNPLTEDVFLCYEDGTEIGPDVDDMWAMESANPFSRLMNGDPITLNEHYFNIGLFQADDFWKATGDGSKTAGWYNHTGSSWTAIPDADFYQSDPTPGDEFPTDPAPVSEDYFEITGGGTPIWGLYKYNGATWDKMELAVPNIGDEYPEEEYTEVSIDCDPATPETVDEGLKDEFAWSTVGDIAENMDEHRFAGIWIDSLGDTWTNLCMVLHDDENEQQGAEITIAYADVQAIVEHKELDDQNRYIYFQLIEALLQSTNYHYHFYVEVDEVAYHDGTVDMSSGFDWGTTNQAFAITVNGTGPTTVTLDTLCADLAAVRSEINTEFGTAGVTGVEAYDAGSNHIGIKTTATGTTQNFVLAAGTPDALATIGMTPGTYSATDDTTAPKIKGYDDSGNDEAFFKILARPIAGDILKGYPDNNIFKLVYRDSGLDVDKTYLLEDQVDGLDIIYNGDGDTYFTGEEYEITLPATTPNIPLSEHPYFCFVIPVNLSDANPDGDWDRWNYSSMIAYDPRYGRLKFPDHLDPDTYAVEFNANWIVENFSSKAISISTNDNVSLEDIFDLLDITRSTEDILDFVEERIARYSPQENNFLATSGQTLFDLDFTPAGYEVDGDGNLVYDGGSYVGSDAAKNSLIISVKYIATGEGFVLNSNDFELNGKQVELDVGLAAGDKLLVQGAEYRVLTTVANGSITPDHFSSETQQLIQELRDIRDVDFPAAIVQAKIDIKAYVDAQLYASTTPHENIFTCVEGGVAEIHSVDTIGDTAGSLGGTYFIMSSPSTTYWVWYDVDDGSTPPSPGGGETLVEVDISSGDIASVVATNTKTALDNVVSVPFATAISSNELTITNNIVGNVTNVADGGSATGFTFDTDEEGTASVLEVWKDGVYVKDDNNDLELEWIPYGSQEGLLVSKNAAMQTKDNFTLTGVDYDIVTMDIDLVVGDIVSVKGNVVRSGHATTTAVEPVEDVFVVSGSPQSDFTCSFLVITKEQLDVYRTGVHQDKNKYTIGDTSTAAIHDGTVDLSSGHDWSSTNDTFTITVNEIGPDLVTLDANCGNLAAVISHINTAFSTAGVAGIEAYDAGSNHVGFRTTATGLSKSFILVDGTPNNALTTLGMTAETYRGTDGYTVVTMLTPVPIGQTLSIKAGKELSQSIQDELVEYRHLSDDLKTILDI